MYPSQQQVQKETALIRDWREWLEKMNSLNMDVKRLANADADQIGGSHYKDKSIQPWAVMESWMGKSGFAFYLQGNVLKYISRYREKNGIEDLKKAKHYLEKLIEIEEVK